MVSAFRSFLCVQRNSAATLRKIQPQPISVEDELEHTDTTVASTDNRKREPKLVKRCKTSDGRIVQQALDFKASR
jgi:hypothetical protein